MAKHGDAALSPDGRLLAAYVRSDDGAAPNAIQVWDIGTGQKVASLRDCTTPLWSPDGRHLTTIARGTIGSTTTDALVKVWEVADPTPTYRLDQPITAISSPPDGHRLAVDDQLWEVGSEPGPAHLKPLPRPVPADLVVFTGTGALYATRLRKKDITKQFEQPTPFWELEPRHRELTLSTYERVEGVSWVNEGRLAAFSPDGRLAAIVWQPWATDGKSPMDLGLCVDLWELETMRRVQILYRETIKVTYHPNGGVSWSWNGPGARATNSHHLAWSPDSQTLAVAYDTGVVIYRASDGQPVRELWNMDHLKRRRIPVYSLSFSPDGRWIYYAGQEGRLNIGSVQPVSGGLSASYSPVDPQSAWTGHEETVLALSVSPDGRTLASGGVDRIIRLWEVPTGRPLARWEAHDASISALAFRPDGRTLVSGDTDGMLKLWDLPSLHRELAALGLDW
jgi:WD40 repeat protein